MNHYRITKYNPIDRDANGFYLKPEWTSISDIGREFNGEIFTEQEYYRTERAYLNVIQYTLKLCGIRALKISELERYTTLANYDLKMNSDLVGLKDILLLSKLALREEIWCKLSLDCRFYVHFGYDYYMYIGCARAKSEFEPFVESQSLYIEEFRSPYL